MHKTYKFRLYPTKEQEQTLLQWLGSCRKVWNLMLNLNVATYKDTNKFVFYNQMASNLVGYKKVPELYYLKEVPSQALQQKCMDLNQALVSSFKQPDKGFPKFKARNLDQSGIRLPQGFHFEGNRINLPKMKGLKIKKHREIEGKISSCTIKRDRCGNWFVCILAEMPNVIDRILYQSNTVGIDVGLKTFATLSTGETIENPKYLTKAEKKLKKKQRLLSKKKKGSNNRNKARLVVAKQHKKVSNQRLDFVNKSVNSITKNYDIICIEDLNVKNMLQNRNLAKYIIDVGWGIFFNKLKQKADERGNAVVQIGRFEASTKTCSCCGNKQDMPLAVRIYKCINCCLELDRDLNAAINIRNWGLNKYTAGTAEIYACGDMSPCMDSTQEASLLQG